MSNAGVVSNGRDQRTGRFLAGNIGGGRKPGSRGKVAEAFLADAYQVWRESGIESLRATAATDPARFCSIISSILPKEAEISLDIDVKAQVVHLLEDFRSANIKIDRSFEATLKRLMAPTIDADSD
jgi:hypothetical protein